MQNYKDLVLQNEIGNIQMTRPIKGGESIIDTYPLDVIERLGKYQFIYDYSANSSTSSYNMNNWVNFSKGDVVEVVRFQLGSAIINNPNYKDYSLTSSLAPDTSVKPKWDWGQIVAGFGNKKELEIPKEYLQKVDDSTSVTIPTGVNFGANPKPQPISIIKPIPQVSSEVILEENATFVLTKDFSYQTNEYVNTCPQGVYCITGGYYKQGILKAGTKVTGRLFKTITSPKKNIFSPASVMPNAVETDFLAVKGYGSTGSINIPIEYLTREVSTNTNNNNGNVVPAKYDNKDLLMIAGAFLVGYLLFNNDTPTT
jgi:putative transposon-encoded protein